VAGFCEHTNELSDTIRGGNFFTISLSGLASQVGLLSMEFII
jgi:hypothetical protein